MKKVGFIAGLMTLLVGCQAAQAACYERVYSGAHLKQHKLQEITKMRLSLDGDGTLTGRIDAAFRESSAYLGGPVQCVGTAADTTCEILADGGGFTFTRTKNGIRLVNTSSMRFGDEENGISIGDEAEHRVFLLFETTDDNCRI